MKQRLLIVGAGMASAYLLRELAQRAHDFDITLVGDESQYCYNRVLLSEVLAGEKSPDDLEMLQLPPLQLLASTRVTGLDLEQQVVLTDDGSELGFDKLVLATGASVARPALDCDGIAGVEVFRTLQDTQRLQQLNARGRRAVVIGGGLLGLEAAHGLNSLGFATEVIHRNSVLMNRQLDAAGGRYLQQQLERRGIGFHLANSVAELHAEEEGALNGLTLADGSFLSCDLLVLATGIVPNAALAGCGLARDRGVLVDGFMRTSADSVYALGECCQFGDHCFGLVAPVQQQAAVLARELCGEVGEPFTMSDWPTQLKISGIDIYRAGELDEGAEQLLLEDSAAGIYRRLMVRDDRLVGAVLVGDKRGGSWYAELIAQQTTLAGLRHGLMFGRKVSEAQQLTATAA